MHISPTDADWAFAKELHGAYAAKPGARHIASAFALALAHLSAVLNSERPDAVLEFGAGIGTMTQFLLQHPSQVTRVTATEENPFCIEELKKNIGDRYAGRYELLTEAVGLATNNLRYDLVVTDGLLEPDQYKVVTLGPRAFDLPPLNWSARIVRERRIRYGNQTTQA